MPADTIQRLEQAKRDIIDGVDQAIITLKGSVEFRNAVEELLKGTAYEKPATDAHDFEGLYGRLRNALYPEDLTRRIEALITKWREGAVGNHYFVRLALLECANELAALVRDSAEVPTPPGITVRSELLAWLNDEQRKAER